MKRQMKKRYLVTIIGVIAILSVVALMIQRHLRPPTKDSDVIDIHGSTPTATAIPASKTPSSTVTPKPTSAGRKVIDVPFTVQAPYGNWDALHEEMCEEGTIVMAHAWVSNIALTPAYAEQQIQRLAKWETDNFGTYIDTSAAETGQMARAVYGLKTKIIKSPSVQDIKDEIDAGNVVIMGMAGRMLHNPYYTPPGPPYHMLLIKGYDATGFITNDDGTKRGESYQYSYSTLMAAAHDWGGDMGTLTNEPAVALVINK